jgi:redox-sensitive bicupin YhaK (pirin superfamily)
MPFEQARELAMLEDIIEQRRRSLGGGMEVGRVLPYAKRRMVGPFIFFDHMGPLTLSREAAHGADVRPHPHIGLSTVTYLLEGEIVHRDSVGSEQTIRPGEMNWMTAGSGISHSERFEKARIDGARMHGLQIWVALPDGQEEIAPSFVNYGCEALPVMEEAGVWSRVIAGEAFGVKSPATIHSPLFYTHCILQPGGVTQLPSNYAERAAYVVSGSVEVEHQTFEAGRMLVFAKGQPASVKALTPAIVMLIGGEPVGERFIEWNFVSSSKQRIEQAKADWRAGRMKLPDLDHDEFIPLPE